MLTVDHDGDSVEADLLAGLLECPGCGGRLRPWSFARTRRIRHGVDEDFSVVEHRPRRARCAACLGTHVLLSVVLAGRRADGAAVIAAAILKNVACGFGYRRLADWLSRPASTVRGWLRAFDASAPAMAAEFTALVLRDAPDPAAVWAGPEASAPRAAVAAVRAYAQVVAERSGVDVVAWQVAGLAVMGPWFFCAQWWAGETNTS